MLLQRWQESQTVLLDIDHRWRFRCVLCWLQASTAERPKRITQATAAFLEQHARDQYEILVVEDLNMQDIMQVRQEEGLPLSAQQMGRVVDIDEDMQQAAEAMKKAHEVVVMVVELGLVEGATAAVEVGSEEAAREHAERMGQAEPPIVDMDWNITCPSRVCD